MVEQNPAGQQHDDLGALLAAMATDAPPVPTAPDELPVAGSPLDAALAALHAACQLSDADNDNQLGELHEQRQDTYRSAINDASGDSQ